ncbi:MAG: hypothetical protein IJ202_10925, partial [Bacteroidales bacterium]|nr:hypothetical protein [Bacteroidales bacterium]
NTKIGLSRETAKKKHRKIATFPMFHSFFTARGMKGINYFRFFDASVLLHKPFFRPFFPPTGGSENLSPKKISPYLCHSSSNRTKTKQNIPS